MKMNSSLSDASDLFAEELGTLFGSLLMTVCILGILGNSFIVFAFAKKLVPLTPFCMLLLNLSVADIFTDIVYIPKLFKGITEYIEIQRALCGTFKFGLLINLGFRVNFCTVAYISCIRATTIENGSSERILNKRVVSYYILGTWIISIASTLPLSLMITSDPNTGSCKPRYGAFYSILPALGALFYLLPQTILVVNFVRTVWHMWRKQSFEQSVVMKRRKKIGLLLLSLTTVYTISFIPIHIWQLMRALGSLTKYEMLSIYRPSALMAYLTTIGDPVLYAVCCRNFRHGFIQSHDLPTQRDSIPSCTVKNRCSATISMT